MLKGILHLKGGGGGSDYNSDFILAIVSLYLTVVRVYLFIIRTVRLEMLLLRLHHGHIFVNIKQ